MIRNVVNHFPMIVNLSGLSKNATFQQPVHRFNDYQITSMKSLFTVDFKSKICFEWNVAFSADISFAARKAVPWYHLHCLHWITDRDQCWFIQLSLINATSYVIWFTYHLPVRSIVQSTLQQSSWVHVQFLRCIRKVRRSYYSIHLHFFFWFFQIMTCCDFVY